MTILYDDKKQRIIEVEFIEWCNPCHYSFNFDCIESAIYINKVSTYCCITDLDEYMRFYRVSIVSA